MPIKYYLQRNHVAKGQDDHAARILSNTVNDLDSIVKKMIKRGTGTSETDILASLKLFFEVVTDEVLEGNHVNTPLANFKPGIIGVFSSLTDNYDPARHSIKANVSNGTLLTNKMLAAVVEKTLSPVIIPRVMSFTDIFSDAVNTQITPNGMGAIVGDELKFNPENPAEGIFFVNGTTTRVEKVGARTEGRLMFAIPALTPGEYKLEVRKAYKNGLEIRTGTLNQTLIVT